MSHNSRQSYRRPINLALTFVVGLRLFAVFPTIKVESPNSINRKPRFGCSGPRWNKTEPQTVVKEPNGKPIPEPPMPTPPEEYIPAPTPPRPSINEGVHATRPEDHNSKVAIFAAIPQDDGEFASVFDDLPTNNQMRKIKKAQRIIDRIQHYPSGSGRIDFEKLVSDSPASVVIVIGHNRVGSFKFPDGESLTLQEMESLCHDSGKFGVFLSCESARHLTDSVGSKEIIELEVAAQVALKLSQKWKSAHFSEGYGKSLDGTTITAHDREMIEQTVNAVIDETRVEYEFDIKRFKLPAAGVATAIVISIRIRGMSDDDDRDRRHKRRILFGS